MFDRPVTEVLTKDAEIIGCFRSVGWDPSLRGGKGEWTLCPPDWHTACNNLNQLRAVLAREAERSRRPMVLLQRLWHTYACIHTLSIVHIHTHTLSPYGDADIIYEYMY